MPKQALPQRELDFQHKILDLAALQGYKRHHCRTCRTSTGGYLTAVMGEPGFPDLVLAKPGRKLLILELKTDTSVIAPAQKEWLEVLDGLGADVFLWRPKHWDEIVAYFASGAAPEAATTQWKGWRK